jgi:signal transduction histidine kinase
MLSSALLSTIVLMLAYKGVTSAVEESFRAPLLQMSQQEHIYALFHEKMLTVFVGLPFGILFLGTVLSLMLLRPFRRLLSALEATTEKSTSLALPVKSSCIEINKVADFCNEKVQRIDRLGYALRESLDNVAHDLRTPLTRMRGLAEISLLQEDDLEAQREALIQCVEETDKVLKLLNTLMDISEAEAGALRLKIEGVNIKDLLEDVVDLYSISAEEKGVCFEMDISKSIFVELDRIRIHQVLSNLLDNAIKYTPVGKIVSLRSSIQGRYCRLEIQDQGVGIAADEVSKVWERLYRIDKSRSQRGLGLGLSLVRALVQSHGGRVELHSLKGEGSTFVVSLPLPLRQGKIVCESGDFLDPLEEPPSFFSSLKSRMPQFFQKHF